LAIIHSLPHPIQESLMIYPVEELGQVEIDHPLLAFLEGDGGW
jgi:hypothetical protein